MADVTFTAANVRPLNNAVVRRGAAGATLTPGQFVYLDGANGWKLADGSAAASSRARGVVVAGSNGAVSFASGERVDIVTYGPVEGFSSMTPGAAGFVSDTAGAIDQAGAGTNSYLAGWAESTSVFFVAPGLTQSEALFDADNVATVANANTVGGLPVLYRIDCADASANVDVVVANKIRVIDAWGLNTGIAAHAANDTWQVKNGTNAISDAVAKTATVNAVKRISTIDPARHEIAAGGTLRITTVKDTNAAVTVYVLAVPVA